MSKKIKAKLLKYLTRKKTISFNLKDTKKILFIRYDRIGDMVITTPVFRELKQAYPNIEISVLASNTNKDILLNNPYVNKVYTNHKNEFLNDFSTLLKLRKENFDVAVEFDHSVIPHAILRLKIINPKKIISVHKDGRYGVNGEELEMYDFYTPASKESHFRDIWLDTLQPFDINSTSNKYDIFYTKEQGQAAKNFVNQFRDKTKIGINLEGAVKGKQIKKKELYKICQKLYENNQNIQIIILTTPNKKQQVDGIISDMKMDFITSSYITKSILDVAALIDNLDLIITPDTSIVHIAAAFDKPIVTIHENNKDSYRLFAPTSTLNKTVFAKSKNGLDGYKVDDVIEYSLEFIEKINKEKYE
ncbi:MAG: glycosyltransferase family 9 protein [Arcobacteraceae bacterium]|nr:glycosyltransferase family 9 protein [Arcobacteraceae bacterium]